MKCIRCGAWTSVLETRQDGKVGSVRRRRSCANGCKCFATYEISGVAYDRLRKAEKLLDEITQLVKEKS